MYIFGFGLISAVPAIPLLLRFRELDRNPASSRRREPEFIVVLRTRFLIGTAVAEVPAMMGLIHAMFTGQTMAALVLCLLSIVLVYCYRPLP